MQPHEYRQVWKRVRSLLTHIQENHIAPEYKLHEFAEDEDLDAAILEYYTDKLRELDIADNTHITLTEHIDLLITLENTIRGTFCLPD